MLEAIVHRLPAPKGDETAPLKALLVDLLVRRLSRRRRDGAHHRRDAEEGPAHPHDGGDAHYEIDRIGVFRPKMTEVGDWDRARSAISPRRSSRSPTPASATRSPTTAARPTRAARLQAGQPVVFCGLFPVDAADFEDLRAAMGRLRLNDASFSYEMETSAALGFGFRCGFLGLLHLEIIQERLEREFNLDLIATAPSVIYRISLTDGSEIELHNPADMPDPVKIEEIQEPWIRRRSFARRISRRDPESSAKTGAAPRSISIMSASARWSSMTCR